MNANFYSVRMHADRDSRHVSGAERLVAAAELDTVVSELLGRAMAAVPGSVWLRVDEVDSSRIVHGALPDLTLMPKTGYRPARSRAIELLVEAGVTEQSACLALNSIAAGPSSAGHAMRGAMLIDAASGARLESDPDRGVRVTCMDMTAEVSVALTASLKANGLQHSRTREALVLAAKVLACPGVIAELCWSDAPDYTAGYIASPRHGYCRFPELKPTGDSCGGRAFFVQPGFDLDTICDFLQNAPFLADRHGTITFAKEPL